MYRARYNDRFGELGISVSQKWPEKHVIGNKGKKNDLLGLAISGGGYRSAIFAYGILKGLYRLDLLKKIDYLSAVSGGSWISTPFAMADDLDWFFHDIPTHANTIEEGFESLLVNPARLSQEAALSRRNPNYISNIFGRLLARTFLREHGQESRYRELSDRNLIKDADRPFLIINGTVNYRMPDNFSVTQECFEMTRLYAGCRSLGYIHSKDLMAREKPIRIRDAIAISGAAVAYHLPALGGEVAGIGLSREVVNYARSVKSKARLADTEYLDISDGGHYNNLGIESLINRGCGYLIVVDGEHDREQKDGERSNQAYHGLRTLIKRHHIKTPMTEETLEMLDEAERPVHLITGSETIPDILYIKLKSMTAFDEFASDQPYNQPGFLRNLFNTGQFTFDPQFSTAKLDYDFAEHRNLSALGSFVIQQHRDVVTEFVGRSS